jgi:RNA polymerase sigma factor (sigma-70 family)
MVHHNRHFIAATDAERLQHARKRRLPLDAADVERLVLAAARGDRAGWNGLIKRFTAAVRAVARMHRLSPHDVEDVVQSTWLRLYEHIDSVRDPSAVGAWLDTTARRESLRVIRGASRERPTEAEMLPEATAEPVGERALVAAERMTALAASLERLPPTQRRLMTALLAEPAPSYVEVSRMLGTPVGSIGPTRARSLERLRRDTELARVVGQEG